jgi:hypothetical protein
MHISETYSLHPTDGDHSIEQELALPVMVEEQPRPITIREINSEIQMLNPNKESGIDLITVKMLKELPEKTVSATSFFISIGIYILLWACSSGPCSQ